MPVFLYLQDSSTFGLDIIVIEADSYKLAFNKLSKPRQDRLNKKIETVSLKEINAKNGYHLSHLI